MMFGVSWGDVGSIAAVATVVVLVVGAIAAGAVKGVGVATDRRIANQAGQLTENATEIQQLRDGREADRREFDRKMADQAGEYSRLLEAAERRYNDTERDCAERLGHMQGQLDALQGGLVDQVGTRIGERIDRSADDVAQRVIAHLDSKGAPPHE